MSTLLNDIVRNDLVDALSEGLTIRDATRELDLSEKTVRGWLTRGRKEAEGPYAELAAAVDGTRRDRAELEGALSPEELRRVVWRAARKGSVQAMKLAWEMLKRDEAGGGPASAPSPFDELDGEVSR